MPHLFSWANVVVQSKVDQVADAKLAERIIDTDSAVWLLPTESPTGRFWRKAAHRRRRMIQGCLGWLEAFYREGTSAVIDTSIPGRAV